MPPPICPPPSPAPWRNYPYLLVAGDPQLVFPAAEGYQGVATDTYYASGFLQGETTGRRYAFLTIFAKNREIFDLLSADFHVLALFDIESDTYDTGSRFDLPPTGPINLDRINVTRGHLDVSYTQVGFSLGWELDVWGRIRRLTESARAQYLATEEARHGVIATLPGR